MDMASPMVRLCDGTFSLRSRERWRRILREDADSALFLLVEHDSCVPDDADSRPERLPVPTRAGLERAASTGIRVSVTVSVRRWNMLSSVRSALSRARNATRPVVRRTLFKCHVTSGRA